MGKVFANSPGDLGSIPGSVIPKTLKMVLDTSLLNTQRYKVLSRVKWSNPKHPPLGVVAIEKGALDYGRQQQQQQQNIWRMYVCVCVSRHPEGL